MSDTDGAVCLDFSASDTLSVNDLNGHYMPTTFTYSASGNQITLTPTLYKNVTVYLGEGSQTVPEGVALYVLDKRDNRVGPFRTNVLGVAHVASALVNGTESDFRLLVEDARY